MSKLFIAALMVGCVGCGFGVYEHHQNTLLRARLRSATEIMEQCTHIHCVENGGCSITATGDHNVNVPENNGTITVTNP